MTINWNYCVVICMTGFIWSLVLIAEHKLCAFSVQHKLIRWDKHRGLFFNCTNRNVCRVKREPHTAPSNNKPSSLHTLETKKIKFSRNSCKICQFHSLYFNSFFDSFPKFLADFRLHQTILFSFNLYLQVSYEMFCAVAQFIADVK